MKKYKIRKKILVKRDALCACKTTAKSNKIADSLFLDNDYRKARKVLFYVSFGSEVMTTWIMYQSYPGKEVFVPKVNLEKMILEIYRVKGSCDLEKGAYGIFEPKTCETANINDMDLVIVPGVAFDLRGYRVGYGKGFYDKLLKDFKGPKIGLAYGLQIVKNIPKSKHDIPVDKIITEDGVISCG